MHKSDKDGRGGNRPGAGRPKGSVKEDKVMRGIRLPRETWDKIDALKPEGVTLAKFMEAVMEQATEDRLVYNPVQEVGIEESELEKFMIEYLEEFPSARPFSALSAVIGWISHVARTKSYHAVKGSFLTADDAQISRITRFVLGYTTYPIALVARAGAIWLVWWGESDSPEVAKFRQAGKVLYKAGQKE